MQTLTYVRFVEGRSKRYYGCVLTPHLIHPAELELLARRLKVKAEVVTSAKVTQDMYCALQRALRLLHAKDLRSDFAELTVFSWDVLGREYPLTSLYPVLSLKIAQAAIEVARRESQVIFPNRKVFRSSTRV